MKKKSEIQDTLSSNHNQIDSRVKHNIQTMWCANYDRKQHICRCQDEVMSICNKSYTGRIECPGRECKCFTLIDVTEEDTKDLDSLRNSWFLRLDKETDGDFGDLCMSMANTFLMHDDECIGVMIHEIQLKECVVMLAWELLSKITDEQLENELKLRKTKRL